MRRQALNVFRMRLLGAKVRPVDSGSCTLKDAINEAMRDWVTNVANTHYLLGSVLGAHPYPWMVRDFQAVIGQETRLQVKDAEGRLPDCLVACVGVGSNAMGLFHPFLDEPAIKMIGVEAAGRGIDTGEHAATLSAGSVGILHGAMSYLLHAGIIQPRRHRVGRADLSVLMTDAPDPAVAGRILTYTITLTNKGPDPARNITLRDATPAGLAITEPVGLVYAVRSICSLNRNACRSSSV